MNQDLTQDAFKGGTTTISYSTGSVVPDTSLWKTTDGKVEFILYLEKDTLFPNFPGGNGTKRGTYTKLTKTADGGQSSFTSVKVVAGTA